MKKIIIMLLLILPSFLFAQDFNQSGQVKFKVRSNHYYEFQVTLKKNTQYCFKLTGDSIFNFRIIESSGNEWELHISDNKEIIVWENIMDAGVYTIRIYSVSNNNIEMKWGEY